MESIQQRNKFETGKGFEEEGLIVYLSLKRGSLRNYEDYS